MRTAALHQVAARKNTKKSLRRHLDQQKRSCQTADYARNHERDHDAPRDVQFLRVSAAARRRSHPKGKRIGGIRLDGRHSGEQERRKSDETPSPCDSVDPSSEGPGKEQEYRVVKVQA